MKILETNMAQLREVTVNNLLAELLGHSRQLGIARATDSGFRDPSETRLHARIGIVCVPNADLLTGAPAGSPA